MCCHSGGWHSRIHCHLCMYTQCKNSLNWRASLPDYYVAREHPLWNGESTFLFWDHLHWRGVLIRLGQKDKIENACSRVVANLH